MYKHTYILMQTYIEGEGSWDCIRSVLYSAHQNICVFEGLNG